MARTGQQQAQQSYNTGTTQANEAYNTGQGAITQTENNLNALSEGKQVASNPWQNPTYLANVNKEQSSALNAETNAGKSTLQRDNLRSGGTNTGATVAAKTGLNLQRMQLGDKLSAQRTAEDWNKNVGYQSKMATEPLSIASAESPYYSTATNMEDTGENNLVKFGLASQNFWDQLAAQGIKTGAGFVLGGPAGALSTLGGGSRG